MKTPFGIAIALVIFRIAESIGVGRIHSQSNLHASNLIDVDTECPKGFSGLIPYAMDCRQYVNCWKGHGTIQNCSPGTMFNPKSMECDHPSKVKCNRFGELREPPSPVRSPPVARIECEMGANGLFPHPTDCARFLNCHNGGTFIQDCGPGTLFNGRLKVCDWPHNTDCANRQGSSGSNRPQPVVEEEVPPYYGEGVIQARNYPSATGSSAYRSSNNNLNTNSNLKYPSSAPSVPLAPYRNGNANGGYGRLTQSADTLTPNPSTDTSWQTYDQLEGQADTIDQAVNNSYEKLIKCQVDWVGLYPHPFDCRNFLNCNNGATFIQDCGPGTAFNPTLQVCDWPQNVNCSRKLVDGGQQPDKHDIEATNTNVLVNHENDGELSPAGTNVHHVTYPQLSQHVDEEFKKYFYDESPVRQSEQIPSIGTNGNEDNLNSQSKHDYDEQNTQLNGNRLASTNINESQNSDKATHNVNYDRSYQTNGNRKYGNTHTPYSNSEQNAFDQTTNHEQNNHNSFTVENQYGTRATDGMSTNVETQGSDSVRNFNYGQTGESTLVNTQYTPSNGYNSYGAHPHLGVVGVGTQYGQSGLQTQHSESDKRQNTQFNRINENHQQNTQFVKQSSESSKINGPTANIFGRIPYDANPQLNSLGHQGETKFNQNTLNGKTNPSGFDAQTEITRNGQNIQSQFESKQNDMNILNNKNIDVKTNLVNTDDKQYDRNGKSNPHAHTRFDDHGVPPFATETGYIGICGSVPGLIKHPYDCSKFVNCENEKAYEQNCAPGTLFNPILKICDFAQKVNCSAGPPVLQQFGISYDLQPPKFDMNEPHTISISNGYSKTTKNTVQSTSTDFSIPNMSVLPLSHNNDDTKYPDESGEHERREPTTPSPVKLKPVYYPNLSKPSQGTDTDAEDIETIVQQIQRPSVPVIRDSKSIVVNEPAPRQIIPKGKEHVMPIYLRRTTTSAPSSLLSIENQYVTGRPNYSNKPHFNKQYENEPIDTKAQTDYLPLNDALKMLLRPYINNKTNETNTQTLEKKILEMADRNNDTKTDHTATLEQSSLAHALFNDNQQTSDGVNREANYDYYAHLDYDRTQKHDQNCQHYHPPSTFFHLPPNFKHSPEFHEYINRKHALSNKEFYSGENVKANTPSNVELLPGAALHQHGYHHLPPDHYRLPHHHHHHHNNEHRWNSYSNRPTTPTTNSLAAPNDGDSLSQTTMRQFTNGHSSRAFTQDAQCANQFNCQNGLCVPFTKVCDGRNDCGNRYDESACQHVGYEIRLSNERNEKHMGRIEVKAFGRWGYVCDDKFNLVDANVVCRELGYKLGADEVKSNSYFAPNANMSVESMFMMDDVNCSGPEASLRECDFNGWGVSDCNAEEVVGVVCKMPAMKCPPGYFLCEASEQCISINFMCDGYRDCSDGADESPNHCDAPIEYRLTDGNEFEGRVEVKYRGIWGTVCDDDFGDTEAAVVCKSLGYNGPAKILNERIGLASGPIWLDQVSCLGNETCLDQCMHFEWGESNCNHTEDISVRCSQGAGRKSEKLVLPQDHNSLGEFDEETQKYIREIQRNSKSMPDYSNVCGQVKVNDDDVESSAEQLGQFRVISGTRTKRGYHPWQATIRARGRNGRSSHWCGAVVLSKNHILTAAHCLIGFPKGAYVIRLGDHHSEVYEDSEVEIFIEDWFIHEEFRKGQHMNNDIALILLKQPIQFSNYIQPICLPTSDAAYEPGRNCTISGWGTIQYGKSTPSLDLKAANVPIISPDVCRQKKIYGGAIMDTMFCAGYLDRNGIDACDGDSGGPLVCADQSGVNSLYGIISWGQRCGDSTKPGVYVKVAKYLDWIKDKMSMSPASRKA